MTFPDVFESRLITAIVGVPPNFLNRLVERKLHGIRPSLRSDVSTGGRRWFTKEDVYGIALVFWLFAAGLRAGAGKVRTSVIQNVLDEIVGKPGATANEAAKRLMEPSWTAMLVIIQQALPYEYEKDFDEEKLQVFFLNELGSDSEAEINRIGGPYAIEVRIPVGNLFERVNQNIARESKAFEGLTGSENIGGI